MLVVANYHKGFVPVLVSPVLTFTIFIAVANSQGSTLDTAKMFTSLALLTLISQPLSVLFQSAPGLMPMVGCFDRIEKFLLTETRLDPRRSLPLSSKASGNSQTLVESLTPEKGIQTPEDGSMESTSNVIAVHGAYFGWKDSEPVLRDIDLHIEHKISRCSLDRLVAERARC